MTLRRPSSLSASTQSLATPSSSIVRVFTLSHFSSSSYAQTVTAGNHTATQSTFAAPCIPAHDANITINGFDSGPRDTVNGTAVTILAVPILKENFGEPFWFYDASPGACGEGAVGVINSNENGNETLAGFEVRASISLWLRIAADLRTYRVSHIAQCDSLEWYEH